jgi:pyrimidine operon attenuation protein/uracil phosphoribosyltransferase
MSILLSAEQLDLTINRLAHQLIENDSDFENVVFIGLQPRGVFLSDAIMNIAKTLTPKELHYGLLDITFYRDDVRNELHVPKETSLNISLEGKKIVLIDDVLYTGRTIRAALDALQDFGRPRKVELCVLVDRRFNRVLPIQPDYCGVAIDTFKTQKVKIDWEKEEAYVFDDAEK